MGKQRRHRRAHHHVPHPAPAPVVMPSDPKKQHVAALVDVLGKASMVGHDPTRHIVISVIRCADGEASHELHEVSKALMQTYHPPPVPGSS